MILTTVVAGLLAAVVFTVPAVQAAPAPDAQAPPSTGAEPTPEPTPDGGAEPAPAPSPDAGAEPAPDGGAEPTIDAAGGWQTCYHLQRPWYGACNRYWGEAAWARIMVHTNHRKSLTICDYSRSHTIGLAIMIDPSGPRAPITYWDENGPQNGRCFSHKIGYSVRKWKFVSVLQSNGRIHDQSLPWQRFPLPRPDF